MNKSEIRTYMKSKKRDMPREEIVRQSEVLCKKLLESPAYQSAEAIYVYLSYNQEVRTDAIIQAAFHDGKTVCVPKVFGDEMKFVRIYPESQIETGAFHIPEPIANEPSDDIINALIVMPGLAFDFEGHRCGYGGGFYDKYLSKNPHHPTVALCYDFQLLDHIDTDSFDYPVDLVISI